MHISDQLRHLRKSTDDWCMLGEERLTSSSCQDHAGGFIVAVDVIYQILAGQIPGNNEYGDQHKLR